MRRVAMVGAGMTPFAEHFELGIKDLIPMAYADCVSDVDKGIDKSESRPPGPASCRPRTVSRPGSWRTPSTSPTSR